MPADAVRPPRALCSTLSRAAAEDPIGTAEPVHHWIAVEHRGVWGRNPLDHAELPDAVRARLRALIARVPRTRVVFIRRGGERPAGVQLFIARTAETSSALWSARVPAIDDVAAFPFEEILDTDAAPREAAPPLALVCTHGQHDSCCGLRGYPVYDALARRYEHVWECSHVGGDRFAANVVVLPAGLYYARVESTDAAEMIAALLENEIVLRHYRGRSCYERSAQVIETIVRRASGWTALDDVRMLDVHAARSAVWLGRATDRSGRVHTIEVAERWTPDAGFLTCSARREEPRRVYEVLRHETS